MIFKILTQLFQLIKERLFVKQKIPEIALFAMVAGYSIAFSYLTIAKLQAFDVNTWDFGIYYQAIHTTAASGKLFYSTPELPYTLTAIPPGTQFAVHFSPILFLIVPCYFLFQTPFSLLLIKSIAIATGAIPVFLLAKRVLGKPFWGLIFAAGYLLYPAVQGVNWYDFQPQAFFIPLALFTILFMEYGRNKLTILFSVLTMSTVETAPFFMIALGLSCLIIQRKPIIEQFKQRKRFLVLKSLPMALILVSIVWIALVLSTVAFLGWQTSFHLSNTRRISTIDPINLLNTLGFNWQDKLIYVVIVLGPFAFLSLVAPLRFLPGAIWVLYSLFSSYLPYYSISFHYLSFVIPFVLASSIFGLGKLLKTSNNRKSKIASFLLCCSIGITTVSASPIGPFHLGNHQWTGPFGVPSVTPHDKYLRDLVDLVPFTAPVLASANVFPQVAQRVNAYVFPFSTTFPKNFTVSSGNEDDFSDFNNTLDTYLRRADYILIDTPFDLAAAVLLPTRNTAKDFGLYAEADGAILLKKGYVGKPIFFAPVERIFRADDLVLQDGTSIVYDPLSESGTVLYHYSADSKNDFWYGPGFILGRGSYLVSFRLKLEGPPPASPISTAVIEWPTVVKVEMKGSASVWYIPDITLQAGNQEILSAISLRGEDLPQEGGYQTFTSPFEVERPGGFEFVGLSVPSSTRIYLDCIILKQVAPK